MKNLVIILLSFFLLGNGYAQEVQLATLQQGENLQVFYGTDALKNALSASVHGDLITLTAGTFNAANIDKAVTIQGAGYVTDTEKEKYPTLINGEFRIQLPDTTEKLLVEGIYSNSKIEVAGTINAFKLKKCRLEEIRFTGHTINCIIEQCRVYGCLYPDEESENLIIKNSILGFLKYNLPTATLLVENCIIGNVDSPHRYRSEYVTALFRNNIINAVGGGTPTGGYNGQSLSNTCIAYNNVLFNGNLNDVLIQSENQISTSEIVLGRSMDAFNLSYTDTEMYELTEEAKTIFLGTDNTQIGIYGGNNPFTDIPSNPQIIEKSIATRSTEDGKLKVSIKVEVQ